MLSPEYSLVEEFHDAIASGNREARKRVWREMMAFDESQSRRVALEAEADSNRTLGSDHGAKEENHPTRPVYYKGLDFSDLYERQQKEFDRRYRLESIEYDYYYASFRAEGLRR